MLKRILSILMILAMSSIVLIGCSENNKEEATDSYQTDTESEQASDTEDEIKSDEKTIDIYLIAGQSNATGCTKITDKYAISDFSFDAIMGFSNVHYAGNSRSNGGVRDRIIEWQNTTIGLGMNEDHIGPEVGIAKALSAYYNSETGKEAGIIKYAYGGSSLLNKTSGDTHKDGNWVSPSYQKTLSANQIIENVTGQMYRNFLDQVETNIFELKEYGGYTKIRICGMYWMQGCGDKDSPQTYEFAFQCFAKDVRNDLSEIMKKYTGSDDDCGASNMPIVVGTISQTQNLTGASVEQVNIAFINMQKALPSKVDNCIVVDNSAYKITAWENNKQVVYGSDQWHWNQADMLEIGNNVGEALLNYVKNN